MSEPLNSKQRHLLRLVAQDADADGWATASRLVWPFISSLPDALVEKRPAKVGGYARLTEGGKAIVAFT